MIVDIPCEIRICLLVGTVVFYSIAGLHITGNTPERLSFTWEMDGIDTTSILSGADRVTSLAFAGSNVALGEIGEVILPGVSLNVGVPATGNATVSLTPLEVRTMRLAAPAATWNSANRGVPNPGITFSSPWISRPEYGVYRSLRVARCILRPVLYDPNSQSVKILARGTGTITYPVTGTYRPAGVKRTGDYETMLQYLLLNYNVASGFRTQAKIGKRTAGSYPLSHDEKMFYFKIGDGHNGFNEASIKENGIMKITGKKIRELFGEVSTGQVRLFASFKGMLSDTLPADGSIPDGIAEVPLLRGDVNRNGKVDDNDYFLAYVSGASDWVPDANYGYTVKIDIYDDYRTYWLTTGTGNELTIEKSPPLPAAAGNPRSTFTEYRQYRQSRVRSEDNPGNRKWLWKVLSARARSFEQQVELPGLVTGDTARVMLAGGSQTAVFDISAGGEPVCEGCMFDTGYPITDWGDRKVRIDVDEKNTSSRSLELEYFNVLYPRKLEAGDDPVVLTVLPAVRDSGEVTAYRLSIATNQRVYIFRVSDDESDVVLIDTLKNSKGKSREWVDSSADGHRYVICNESALLPLPDVAEPAGAGGGYKSVVSDLRSTANETDFLIITHPDFLPAADSLARHKAHSAGFSRPVVVDVNDIYRYFSGGDKDVAAIRNFIGYITRSWKNGAGLDYVVLMGIGHFDTKNYISTAPDFIPVYIHGNENVEGYFTSVAAASGSTISKPQMAIGRLPCANIDQAWNMVRKIVGMENPSVADMSEWRNRALFVADDDMQGDKEDAVARSTPHHLSSDRTVAVIDSLWPSMDIRKVYLYEYEWDAARQKPAASRALLNEINNGVGYVNFFGHGADVTWTDEYILTQDMVAGMSNNGRYPVVSAFSCSVGRFDIPGTDCLSGALAKAPGVGSIASISSTREAYANANENLAKSFYRFLFDPAASRSIGMAMISALSSVADGSRTYCILGDPSVRAVRPTHRITLAIDGSKKTDTLKALQKVVISGKVVTANGSVDPSFGGSGVYAALGLFNAPDTASRKDNGNDTNVRYVLPGTPVFMGKTPVNGGTFSQTVLLPQNLSFDKPGVKLTAYAWKEHGKEAAVGSRRDIFFSGSMPNNSDDKQGPRITVRPAYDNERLAGGNASFGDHITVQVPVTCEVELFDESGIDAAGVGPDEGVTLEIEGRYARQNVNSKFQFKEGDYRRGVMSVVYEEDALKPGTYQMVVTARDLMGNLSKARFTLEVTDWDELKLDHVFNFPNPFRWGKTTRFYSHTNYTSQQYYGTDVRLTIKIYTLGGRLLRVIRDARNGELWDGCDQQGRRLSPDVYLYRIMGEDYGQKKTVKSKVMKLVILPPK
jgi:hypothetical protein